MITSDEVFEVVCEKEQNKKQKTKVELFATQTHKRKLHGKKAEEQDMDEDLDENIDMLEDDSDSSNKSNDSSDSEDKRSSLPASFKFPPSTDSTPSLSRFWEDFVPTKIVQCSIKKWNIWNIL